jgi:hypothetical protein
VNQSQVLFLLSLVVMSRPESEHRDNQHAIRGVTRPEVRKMNTRRLHRSGGAVSGCTLRHHDTPIERRAPPPKHAAAHAQHVLEGHALAGDPARSLWLLRQVQPS